MNDHQASEPTDRSELSRDQRRSQMRRLRQDLDRVDAIAAAEQLGIRLENLPELSGPGRLGTFWPVDAEIDPNRVLERLMDRGWQPHLPVVADDAPQQTPGAQQPAPLSPNSMRFAPWRPGDPVSTNRFGIAEPVAAPTLSIRQLDLVLLPCVAVDEQGNRLGFGAGYYDRALAASAGPAPWDERDRTTLVALAYDFQVLDAIDAEPWDVPADVVVTDARVIRPLR